MASTPTTDTAERHPDMDYGQHTATYEAFLAMVKWGIVGTLIIVLSLYCFIEAHQPVLGTLLLLLLPVGAVALFVMRSRSAD